MNHANASSTGASAGVSAKSRYANPFGNLGAVRRFIAPAAARPMSVVETAVFMLIVLALAWAFDHNDPLLLHTGFPWLWFAPLIVALRYGTLLGLLADAFVIGAWLLHAHGLSPAAGAEWPLLFFTGGLLQTIVAGHFGDTWGSRASRANAINDYLNDRLVAITNSHYLMRLSHERLEKDLLSKPTTLRDSITELRRLSVAYGLEVPPAVARSDTGAGSEALPGARELLEFVAQACQIEVAALYPVNGTRLAREPVARLGDGFDFDPRDDLVTRALETKSVAHLKTDDGAPVSPNTRLLVCAPLVSADGRLIAMLAIRRMPFLSLNFDNLQLLLVLLGYYADGVEHSHLVRDVLAAVPNCPYDFALDLGRLTRLQREVGIASSLVALVFPHDEAGDSFFEHVVRRRRALDLMWPLKTPTQSVLVNLMPATDTTGVDGYLARIESSLAAQFSLDLEGARIGVHTLHLGSLEPGLALQRFLKRSGVDV
ncbi:PelD GGDEF domain-containing protein [Paraburkholderia flava]|uniref:PelD GGDEF domain-containing protein n=1 Tax=Paraburkholderia flava TaxID=2547393 RepID=UPI00105D21F5|nr:PelD GGDEF domain-containing protein [Paraburkholderia flava]